MDLLVRKLFSVRILSFKVNSRFSLNPFSLKETPLGEAYGIGTYKVVPISPNLGLIEWVKNTQTLKSFLERAGRDLFKSKDLLEKAKQLKFQEVTGQGRKGYDGKTVANMSMDKVRRHMHSTAMILRPTLLWLF